MSDSVLGALITAGASILIAIINKIAAPSKRDGSPKRSPVRRGTPQVAISTATQEEAPQTSARAWYISLGVLLVWMAFSPAFMHHDWAGINFYLIPVFVIPLALIVPISPLKAAWMSLAMFAANFVIGPMSNRLHGSRYDTTFVGNGPGEGRFLEFLLFLGGGTAAVAAGISFLRLKYRRQPIAEHVTQHAGGLAAELEKLANLRATGALSEAEFQRAKERLLEISTPPGNRAG